MMAGRARAHADLDALIVGGGIAGASLGAGVAARLRVAIVEAESQCGHHSTGRSAAFWLESYGGPLVAPLTAASRAFLERPPGDFSERGFLSARGALHISESGWAELPQSVASRRIERGELEHMLPGVRPEWRFATLEPGCADIDVAGLHAAFLRAFRRAGGEVRPDARLRSARWDGSRWTVELEDGATLTAAVLVNAAGAWADQVAEASGVRPLGIAAKRRTMVQLRVGRSGLKALPLVADAHGRFYFKGESDRSIWLSPHDEIDSDPCDAAPEEIDVATAIDRFEGVVDWPIEAVERKWAGLRTFAPDRLPVYGYDADVPSFFWCGGQGGFGIQTAPAAARLAAALLMCDELPAELVHVDSAVFSPRRFA